MTALKSSLRPRIAVLEANRYHEEVMFAFIATAARLPAVAEISVFAPDHWQAAEFARNDLGLECAWLPFDEFDSYGADTPFHLVVANTFPSPAGQAALEVVLDHGQRVFGLVHDIEYFGDSDGAEAALRRWPNLMIGHAGIVPSRPLSEFPAAIGERVTRFVPVLDTVVGSASYRIRNGVALPGALEFARRDISLALRLTARSGVCLRIFGRSRDQGDGPKLPRELDTDRRRLLAETEQAGTSTVEISMDVSCHDFYRSVGSSRFVAVMPVHPDYLHGKLTGAVTAALSCGVPMLALPNVYEYYTGSDPDTFSACMLRLDPDADEGQADEWGALVRDTPPDIYAGLCRAAEKARNRLLNQNVATLYEAITRCTAPR